MEKVNNNITYNKNYVVKIDNVSKVYNKHTWALKKISLQFDRGECVALIGSNQSGKTTLLRILANNLKQTMGSISYNFIEENILKAIGFQKREQAWPVGFKVKDVNQLWYSVYDVQDFEWINKLKTVFGINELENKYLAKLSIIKLQIYAIFLAFISKPELVLIDQLSSDIDFKNEEKIGQFFSEYLHEGNTIILNYPSNYFMENLVTRIIYINEGEIFEDLEIDQVKKTYATVMEYAKSIFKEELIIEKRIKNKSKLFVTINEKLAEYINMIHLIIDQNTDDQYPKVIASIKEIYFSILDLQSSIDGLSIVFINQQAIKIVSKKIKKTIKLVAKLSLPGEYKNQAKLFTGIEKYLTKELKRTFNDDKIIVKGDSLKISMSKQERKQLEKLKEKYIKEEMKIIRRKILKQQFQKPKKIEDQKRNEL